MKQPEKYWNRCKSCRNPIEPGFEMICVECEECDPMCEGCHMTHCENKHKRRWGRTIKERKKRNE
jgi:hypothetical protein